MAHDKTGGQAFPRAGAQTNVGWSRPTDGMTAEPRQPTVHELFDDAWKEAQKAMRKFPQPNYVISKVAEEAGEVVKAAIHCAEGRDTPEHVTEEITQAIAMLLRLYVEGDQVHGLRALAEGDNQ
jgi:phosphoribosyl-ATP pyrophosphohydrolase